MTAQAANASASIVVTWDDNAPRSFRHEVRDGSNIRYRALGVATVGGKEYRVEIAQRFGGKLDSALRYLTPAKRGSFVPEGRLQAVHDAAITAYRDALAAESFNPPAKAKPAPKAEPVAEAVAEQGLSCRIVPGLAPSFIDVQIHCEKAGYGKLQAAAFGRGVTGAMWNQATVYRDHDKGGRFEAYSRAGAAWFVAECERRAKAAESADVVAEAAALGVTVEETGSDWQPTAKNAFYAQEGENGAFAFGATAREALDNLKAESVRLLEARAAAIYNGPSWIIEGSDASGETVKRIAFRDEWAEAAAKEITDAGGAVTVREVAPRPKTAHVAGKSIWTITDAGEANAYGRALGPRRFWASHYEGEKPAHLKGIEGFYAATHAEALARLNGETPAPVAEAEPVAEAVAEAEAEPVAFTAGQVAATAYRAVIRASGSKWTQAEYDFYQAALDAMPRGERGEVVNLWLFGDTFASFAKAVAKAPMSKAQFFAKVWSLYEFMNTADSSDGKAAPWLVPAMAGQAGCAVLDTLLNRLVEAGVMSRQEHQTLIDTGGEFRADDSADDSAEGGF